MTVYDRVRSFVKLALADRDASVDVLYMDGRDYHARIHFPDGRDEHWIVNVKPKRLTAYDTIPDTLDKGKRVMARFS